VDSHKEWSKDITESGVLSFPIIADAKRDIVVKLGMLDPVEKDKAGLPFPARCCFIIGADKKLKLSILYPATTGRNFAEILRVTDSLILTAKHQVATPADWKFGDKCVVTPPVKTEDAKERFTNLEIKKLPSGKEYLRYVDMPPLGYE
jgi:1-Cys peroxiredoxin 6